MSDMKVIVEKLKRSRAGLLAAVERVPAFALCRSTGDS